MNTDTLIDDQTDAINERLAALTSELQKILRENADEIRPHEAAMVLETGIAFGELSHDLAGPDFVASPLASISSPLLGVAIMNGQFICDGLNKQECLKVAEEIGPDWAQSLYHAAVFITKVA